MSAEEPPRSAPIALWRAARELICTIFNLFGAPEDIAAQHTLTAKSHALLLSWLRTGEALLRHLLFIEAAALAPAPAIQSETRTTQRAPRERKVMTFAADQPETWRVSFRCLPSSHARGRSAEHCEAKGGVSRAPRRFLPAWPLAERAEALLRAYNDPTPYAKRLARRLRAKPSLAARARQRPDDLPHRFGEAHFAVLNAACDVAQHALDST